MKELIITDLTRFKDGNPDVCIAATDPITGELYRPQPYIKSAKCHELNIQPGTKIRGDLIRINEAARPHIEDSNFTQLASTGRCSKAEFKNVLDLTLCASITDGFGEVFTERYQKHIELVDAPDTSIITIKVDPSRLTIMEDNYKPGKIKASILDGEDNYFSYLPITDRRFYDFAKKHMKDGKLDELRKFLKSQSELYLRIGLSRNFKAPNDKEGYWLQVNGIYTFPEYYDEVESYD